MVGSWAARLVGLHGTILQVHRACCADRMSRVRRQARRGGRRPGSCFFNLAPLPAFASGGALFMTIIFQSWSRMAKVGPARK